MTHTPGPWVTFIDRSSGEDRFDILPAMRDGEIAHNIGNGDDANLIAAAPDLLDRLKMMVELFDGYQGMELQWAKMAIAKAEGTELV